MGPSSVGVGVASDGVSAGSDVSPGAGVSPPGTVVDILPPPKEPQHCSLQEERRSARLWT